MGIWSGVKGDVSNIKTSLLINLMYAGLASISNATGEF